MAGLIVAGIDPGITGAIAILDTAGGELIDVSDMPIVTAPNGKNEVNAAEVAAILRHHRPAHIKIERVNAMPGKPTKPGEKSRSMGATSAFNFGAGYGMLRGVVAALSIPSTLVTPASWKKAAGLTGKPKDYARTRAIELYPDADLARKKDIGRADAILIARYG